MTEPAFKSVDPEFNTAELLGQSLQYEREKQELSVKDVAQQLCLSVALIRSLEAGDTDALPEPVYVRGYTRSYCRLLKIDPEPLLEKLVLEAPEQEDDDFLPAMNEHVHRLTRLWGSLAVASVIILLMSFWWMEQLRQFEEAPTLKPVPRPLITRVPADTGSAEPAVVGGDGSPGPSRPAELAEITIHASNRSWAHLIDGSGKVLINRMLEQDYRGTIYGSFPLDFKFGDARGVRVWIDGIEYDIKRHISQISTAFFKLEKPAQ